MSKFLKILAIALVAAFQAPPAAVSSGLAAPPVVRRPAVHAPVAGPTAPPVKRRPFGDVQAPMVVRWLPVAPVVRGQVFLATLQVERRVAGLTPLRIELRLPPGVRLVNGQARFTVRDGAAGTREWTWRLRATGTPKAPVVAVVDWQTAAAGYHAEPALGLVPPMPSAPVSRRAPVGPVDTMVPVGAPLILRPPGR